MAKTSVSRAAAATLAAAQGYATRPPPLGRSGNNLDALAAAMSWAEAHGHAVQRRYGPGRGCGEGRGHWPSRPAAAQRQDLRCGGSDDLNIKSVRARKGGGRRRQRHRRLPQPQLPAAT